MPSQPFDDLSDVYEAMIDWPKRLAHEEPFYRQLFERIGARSVVDVACGTGRHAARFRSWGMRVEGADLSPQMIQRARQAFGESDELRWVVRSFDQPIQPAQAFDAAICVGNSLALAPDRDTVNRAIGQMLAAVRPGGAVVVHVLNLWHLPDGPCVWQKSVRTRLARGEVLIVKGVHRCGGRGYVEVVVTELNTGRMQSESAAFWGLEADELARMARQSGAAQCHLFGSYLQEPYDRQQSQDLILLAERAAERQPPTGV